MSASGRVQARIVVAALAAVLLATGTVPATGRPAAGVAGQHRAADVGDERGSAEVAGERRPADVAAERESAEQARARMEHHLRVAADLIRHFERVQAAECPRFASADEWTSYIDAEVDRVVLLLAHLEQAWVEAKRTKDDAVRRAAKSPRRRRGEAHALLAKFRGCAEAHGASLSPDAL
ncbi:MAG TPA: hypothetical protein VNN07_19660, partial [Candidatus Tectomicrobia bacterium]|nr:hypothetical protein [Candidatus Tectomicrobia bacterium]